MIPVQVSIRPTRQRREDRVYSLFISSDSYDQIDSNPTDRTRQRIFGARKGKNIKIIAAKLHYESEIVTTDLQTWWFPNILLPSTVYDTSPRLFELDLKVCWFNVWISPLKPRHDIGLIGSKINSWERAHYRFGARVGQSSGRTRKSCSEKVIWIIENRLLCSPWRLRR